MKVIVLHGENTAKSYLRLSKFLSTAHGRNWEIIHDKLETTPSLFGQERLYVFHKYNLLTKKDIRNLVKLTGTLVIYHEGVVPQDFIKLLPDPNKIEEFNLPKLIWNFLDKPSVKLLHQVVKNEPVEFVFSLLAKRFRDLYWVKIDPKTLPYPSWRVAKLKNQAARFRTTREVVRIINELAEIDIKVKTSRAELISSLDFFIAKHLE